MKRLLLTYCLLIIILLSQAQQTYVYCNRDGVDLHLDYYVPENPREDRTCVVYLFGGGFVSGARNDIASTAACRQLQKKGFYVASVDYRRALEHVYFDSIKILQAGKLFYQALEVSVADLTTAISYLWENADTLGFDRKNIVLTGASSGAITVLQTEFFRCNEDPHVAGLPKDFRPLALVPYAGAIYGPLNISFKNPPAPTCFFHGTIDKIVSYKKFPGGTTIFITGSNNIANHYRKKGYPYWIFRFAERGHEVNAYLPFTIEEFTAFVDATLKNRGSNYDWKCEDLNLRPTKMTHMTVFDLYLH